MCDYCGCRSRALLEDLGGQHEAVGAVIDRLREHIADSDVDAVRRAAVELASHLEPHSRLEEDALYPELVEAGIPADALVHEHRLVDDALRAAIEDPAADERPLRTAIDELEAHIHREEYDLFPAAHQLLSDAAWDRIDARRRQWKARAT